MQQGFFITGTDTGVGKTIACPALLRHFADLGLATAGLKPIASGFELIDGRLQNDDIRQILAASSVTLPHQLVNRYGFEPPIAPHIAADQNRDQIDLRLIANDVQAAIDLTETLLVEGVGGWHVPLNNQGQDIQSLAMAINLPVILVVGLRLGCLNHALLSAHAIQASGLHFSGWVANHIDPDFQYCAENLATLDKLMPAPKLFELPFSSGNLEQLTPRNIQTSFYL